MNKETRPHPDHEWLLLLSDGELPAEARAAMRGHLESCWECRHELQQIERAISDAVQYRKQIAQHLPEPPAPWRDLSGGFAQIDREMAPPSLFARLGEALRMPRYAVPLAAAALGAMVYAVRPAPTVTLPTAAPVEVHTAAPAITPAPVAVPEGGRAVPPISSATPATPAESATASASDLASSALKVYAILEANIARVGEPVEVSRTANAIVVRGYGLDSKRAADLEAQLSAIPFVEARLKESGKPPVEVIGARISARNVGSPFRGELARELGGESQLAGWIDESLDLAGTATLHAHALRRLDAEFAGDTLGAADAAQLRKMKAQHQRAIANQMVQLQRLTSPILRALGGTASRAPMAQTDAALFASVRSAESLLAELVGAKVLSGGAGDLPSRVMSELASAEAVARALAERP